MKELKARGALELAKEINRQIDEGIIETLYIKDGESPVPSGRG